MNSLPEEIFFVYPQWLWGFTLLPLLYWFWNWVENRRKKEFHLFIAEPLWKIIVPEYDPQARRRKNLIWLFALGMIIFAMARPQWGFHEEISKVSGMDIIFLLDVSNSMEVEDTPPSRLKKAKHLFRSIVDRLGGDRVGLVLFGASSYVACPLTTDLEYLMEAVNLADTKAITNQGTDIGVGIETAQRALERGSEDPSRKEGAAPSMAVVLISDGEDLEGQAQEAAANLKKSGIQFFVIGVGTQKGGLIPIRDDRGALQGYKKSGGQAIVSTFNPNSLMQIAATGAGRYWNASTDEVEVEELIRDLNQLSRGDYAERRYKVREDRYQLPLLLALLLLWIEMSLPARKIIKKLTIFLLWLPYFYLNSAEASPQNQSIDTFVENEKGITALKNEKTEEAKRHFGNAQAQSPNLTELDYNQSLIHLGEGNMDRALEALERPSKDHSNPLVHSHANYNKAQVLTKKGDLQGAIQSYIDSIASARQTHDTALEADAKKNLELLLKEQEKKNQQQKEKQDKSQENQKDSQKENQQKQDQKNQQSPKEDKKHQQQEQQNSKEQDEKNKQKNQPQQYTGRREFKSPKLSQDDADRVMAELKNREKELQTRLKRKNAKTQGNPRDW